VNTPPQSIPPSVPPPLPPQPTADKAVPALVLGIVGIVACPVCAPFAWSTASKAERQIDDSSGALGGRGMVTAARVLGIVGTILLVLYVVFFVVWFVFMGLFLGAEQAILDEVPAPP